MHRLLKRQIRRALGRDADIGAQPEEVQRLLTLVDEAYRQSDEDRHMLERSLDLSSDELLKSNGELNEKYPGGLEGQAERLSAELNLEVLFPSAELRRSDEIERAYS